MKHLWREIVGLTGFTLDDAQLQLLERYRDWLRTEAIPAGGLGPAEGSRLDTRHIADSLLFSYPFSVSPSNLADLGAGVGLPGIPLAILWPNTSVTLVDRSGRRVDLAKRAVRILGLDNVVTTLGDLSEIRGAYRAIVSRATVPPAELADPVEKLLSPGGIAVVGGSWINPPKSHGWETIEIPAEKLDQPVWLLIMRRQ